MIFCVGLWRVTAAINHLVNDACRWNSTFRCISVYQWKRTPGCPAGIYYQSYLQPFRGTTSLHTHGDNRLKLFDVDQFSADVSVSTTYAPMDSKCRYLSVAERPSALRLDVEKRWLCVRDTFKLKKKISKMPDEDTRWQHNIALAIASRGKKTEDKIYRNHFIRYERK